MKTLGSDRRSLERRRWDVIVIGTGMGGATIGYALAASGLDVLFCEKGRRLIDGDGVLRGDYPEASADWSLMSPGNRRAHLAAGGRYSEDLEDLSGGTARRFVPFIGSGAGGSTALYGMGLERLFPIDFTPEKGHPEAGESTLPATWPITYADLEPYYRAAERLFLVRGEADPRRAGETFGLRPPPGPLSPGARELHHFLSSKGLHPYRMPLACEGLDGCQCCQGFLCPRDCKNDAARVCLTPAISRFGAHVLDECEVVRLEASSHAVERVQCSWRGEPLALRGDVVVLAAGGLATPKILLQSASPLWPTGLANRSGLVGCNLMRHHIDLYIVFQDARDPHSAQHKELSFTDFYWTDGEKLGAVQGFGAIPPPAVTLAEAEEHLRQGRGYWALPALRLARPLARRLFSTLFDGRVVLATTLEDLPYRDNRVTLSSSGSFALTYRVREYEAARMARFRERMATVLKPYRFLRLKQAASNRRIAHVCGTSRFGNDPKSSVLDYTNRAHDVDNLYVVDASFFPASGGTGPALTIAANALRVAEYIKQPIGRCSPRADPIDTGDRR